MENKTLEIMIEPFVLARYALLPLTRKEKQSKIDKIRRIVDYFQPRIEEKTGVLLGEIKVRDSRYITSDIYPMIKGTITQIIESHKVTGITKDIIELAGNTIGKPLFSAFNKLHISNAEMMACPFNNTIYLPFGFKGKMNFYQDKRFYWVLDNQIVAHELGHILWSKLNLNEKPTFLNGAFDKDYLSWSEGFATFCEQEYFENLYPYGSPPKKRDWNRIYAVGREKVRRVYDIGGEAALKTIPKEWQSWKKRLQENDEKS